MKIFILLLQLLVFSSSFLHAQWVGIKSPYGGGNIDQITIYGSNVFAWIDRAGLFKSTNNGESWTAISSGLKSKNSFTAFTINGSNIFVATNGDGLYLSTDNGITWTSVNSGLPIKSIYTLAVSGENIFAGTAGVYLSTDNGSSWNGVNSGLPTIGDQYLPPNNLYISGSNIFAVFNNEIYRSTNNGSGWTKFISTSPKYISSFAINNKEIIIGVTGGGLILSTDNGTSWTETYPAALINSVINLLAISGENIYASTNGPKNGLYRSTDNGITWASVYSGLESNYIKTLAVSGENIYVGTEQRGMYLSTNNGNNWTSTNSGTTYARIDQVLKSGSNIFARTYYGFYQSTNEGNSWSGDILGLPTGSVHSLQKDGENIFAFTGNGVFLSTDNGANWKGVYSGLPLSVNLLSTIGTNIFACTADSVYLSTDTGSSWRAASSGLPKNPKIASFASSGGNILLGCSFGIYLSSNNGNSWTLVSENFSKYVTSIDCFAKIDSIIFAGAIGDVIDVSATAGGGIYFSTNNGISWSFSLDATINIVSLVISGSKIFAAGQQGEVLLSTNNGSSWTSVIDDFTVRYISSLSLSNPYIYAGTDNGIWRRPLSDFGITDVGKDSKELTTQFSLEQNYPNPFNPTTMIKFSLPKVTYVTIKVYDALGREVTTLVNEEKTAGNYKIKFDGSKIPSGVYIYRIRAGQFVETRKMILMK